MLYSLYDTFRICRVYHCCGSKINIRYMMSDRTDKKLSFLVKKISKELGIQDDSHRSVDIIHKNLVLQYVEYSRKNAEQLKANIANELHVVMK